MHRLILDTLDHVAKESLVTDCPEDALIEFYEELWTELKMRNCTSSGFTGVSEYLFYRAICYYLEDINGQGLSSEGLTEYTQYRQSDKLIVTHDIDLRKINPILPEMRSDIAIFRRDNASDTCHQLIGVFEVKIYISGPGVRDDLLHRFDRLMRKTDAAMFAILFCPQYIDYISEYYSNSKYKDRVFIISKSGKYPNFQATLKDAVRKILEIPMNI